jgi:S1-C subfamily serine protease|uniref:PDZ domain-containing protein n=1 Tax=Candidatus Methanosuratincola petrocarbonis (ex Vanwonterghem et al. 2016) TaxID=1867261 RepID=A0A7J3UYJ6_9CREN
MSEPPRRQTTLALFIVVLVIGCFTGYYLGFNSQLESLNSRVSALETQLATLRSQAESTAPSNLYTYQTLVSLNPIYESVKDSVVTIKGLVRESGLFGIIYYSEVIGSGFVVNITGEPLIVTNYHVVDGMINGSATFINGEAYPFKVVGTDPYSDLAILRLQAPADLFKPLTVVSSKTLKVGDTVIAIGNPYGLQSTLTTGVVSQLERAIQTESSGNYLIAGLIQISTPINPGNSGGPLLDTQGRVVGITTAIISGSQNVGFAVPSDAVLREIYDLINKGSYSHPYLGVNGLSIDYPVAQATGLNITCGVLIQSVDAGSPASSSGLKGGTSTVVLAGQSIRIGGDVIIQVNDSPIKTMDDLSSYLEENTIPGQTVNLKIIRGGAELIVPVTLGIRR